MRLPRREVMIIATGGQGESRAALARIAFGQHKLALDAGDLVIFSSKQIPGNEIAIGRIQNELAARGIEMITDRQAPVHVSGHPGRPELAAMYDWIRPDIIVPVHGEMRHMMEQARFGLSKGIPQALVQSDGDIVRLAPGKPEKLGHAPVGRLMLDGDVILPADGATMNERRRVATYGQMSVAVAIDGNKRLIGSPRVGLQGVPVEEDRDAFIDEAIDAAAEVVKKHRGDVPALRESLRLGVRRVATRWTGKKPVVDVLVIEA
jgi:ribonuclease J